MERDRAVDDALTEAGWTVLRLWEHVPLTDAVYVATEGPLGLPMQDRQAFQLESILKALPPEDRALKHAVVAKAPTELLDGERADVSWISTEEIDRDKEIVVSRGMNDAHFKLNPLVTLQHAYWRPPVGRAADHEGDVVVDPVESGDAVVFLEAQRCFRRGRRRAWACPSLIGRSWSRRLRS